MSGRRAKNLRAHPFADLFPMMGPADEAELRASMTLRGWDRRFPVILFGGKILDGRNRYGVACSMGLDPTFEVFKGDDDDALSYVLAANLARRHLSTSQRAMVASRLVTSSHGGDRRSDQAAALPLVSQFEAASKLGVSERSVRAACKVQAADPELAQAVERGELTVAKAEGVLRPHVARSTGNFEWHTPAVYCDAARKVLGKIDLDPASCAAANRRVKARRFYTVADDGLSKPWRGRLWLNPPYDRTIGKWIDRLMTSRVPGGVTAAITLTNNASETAWGQQIIYGAASLCFPEGRIEYLTADGRTEGNPLQGQVFGYFGEDPDLFESVFGVFGACTRPRGRQRGLELRT